MTYILCRVVGCRDKGRLYRGMRHHDPDVLEPGDKVVTDGTKCYRDMSGECVAVVCAECYRV